MSNADVVFDAPRCTGVQISVVMKNRLAILPSRQPLNKRRLGSLFHLMECVMGFDLGSLLQQAGGVEPFT